MTNTYKWLQVTPSGLNSVTVEGQTLHQAFTTIDWRMSGTDGENTAEVYGQVSLGEPDPANFVPADNVPPETILGWLTDALGAGQIAAHKAIIDQQLADMALPPTFTGTPIVDVPA